MPEPQKLTLEYLAQLLEHRGLISGDQRKELVIRGRAQESRLFALQHSGTSRRSNITAELISPSEVVVSFNFEIPGTSGQILTEDVITETLAAASGLPYLKIDPLALDLNVVTAHIPRPFALKNLIVAVAESANVAGRDEHLFHGQDGTVHAEHVIAFLHGFAPPEILEVAFQLSSQRAVIPATIEAAVEFASLEDEAAAFAQRYDFLHAGGIGGVFVGHVGVRLGRRMEAGDGRRGKRRLQGGARAPTQGSFDFEIG